MKRNNIIKKHWITFLIIILFIISGVLFLLNRSGSFGNFIINNPPVAAAYYDATSLSVPTSDNILRFVATGKDTDGSIRTTTVFVDGRAALTCYDSTCSYSTYLSPGAHTYSAQATDNMGSSSLNTPNEIYVLHSPLYSIDNCPNGLSGGIVYVNGVSVINECINSTQYVQIVNDQVGFVNKTLIGIINANFPMSLGCLVRSDKSSINLTSAHIEFWNYKMDSASSIPYTSSYCNSFDSSVVTCDADTNGNLQYGGNITTNGTTYSSSCIKSSSLTNTIFNSKSVVQPTDFISLTNIEGTVTIVSPYGQTATIVYGTDYVCNRGTFYFNTPPDSLSAQYQLTTMSNGQLAYCYGCSNLIGTPASGTWTIYMTGQFDNKNTGDIFPYAPATGHSPCFGYYTGDVILHIAGKEIQYNTLLNYPAFNNPQIWNWHMGGLNDYPKIEGPYASTKSKLIDYQVEPQEDPGYAEYFSKGGYLSIGPNINYIAQQIRNLCNPRDIVLQWTCGT